MLTKVYSAAIHGIDAFPVTIETMVENGTLFNIVGMADTAVKESHLRIQSALKSAGLQFPHADHHQSGSCRCQEGGRVV